MSARRAGFALIALGALGLVGPARAVADPVGKTPAPTPEARREGVRRAFAWLADHVSRLPDVQGTPQKPFTTAVAGLDFLAGTGPTGIPDGVERARRCRDTVIAWIDVVERRSKDVDALPTQFGAFDSAHLVQTTWVLGMACVFLSEGRARGAFGAESTAAIRRAVALLLDVQDANGGFGHHKMRATDAHGERPAPAGPPPRRGRALEDDGYPATLISCTNVAALGLAIAKGGVGRADPALDAGLDRLVVHYQNAQLANGNFPYDTSQRSADLDRTGVGRTAGALAALYAIGVSRGDAWIAKSERFLDGGLAEVTEGHGSPALNVFLGEIAARERSPDAAAAYEAHYVPRILAKQAADGSLDCVCEGKVFGVTCDSPTAGVFDGMTPGVPMMEDGQRAYVTALLLLPLLFDAPDRLRVLPPGKALPADPTVTLHEPTPAK
jgi:hypothetical protein